VNPTPSRAAESRRNGRGPLIKSSGRANTDGAEGDIITGRLQPVDLGLDADDEPVTSCVIVPVEGEPVKPAAKATKKEPKSVKVFRAAFAEALDVVGKTIHVRGDGPAVRAVDLKNVRTQFYLRWATGEDLEKRKDAQRMAFNRALNALPDSQFATWIEGDATEWIWRLK
jgi:hypothetical protein